MKIFVGSDHAGFELKTALVTYLKSLGHEVEDKGAHEYDESDDYPDFIAPVAVEVSKNPEGARGIILGGSGQGEAICANRFQNVRAAVFYGEVQSLAGEESIIELSRKHNDANVLSLGARFIREQEMLDAVHIWLETPFSGEEKHERRIRKLDNIHE